MHFISVTNAKSEDVSDKPFNLHLMGQRQRLKVITNVQILRGNSLSHSTKGETSPLGFFMEVSETRMFLIFFPHRGIRLQEQL